MTKRLHLSNCAIFCIAVLLLCAASARPGTKLIPVSRENLCITEGTIEELPAGRLSVNASKMRAYLNVATPQLVEARFTYLGGTENEARLGSGQLCRQFGLKLRAQDACNLVFTQCGASIRNRNW